MTKHLHHLTKHAPAGSQTVQPPLGNPPLAEPHEETCFICKKTYLETDVHPGGPDVRAICSEPCLERYKSTIAINGMVDKEHGFQDISIGGPFTRFGHNELPSGESGDSVSLQEAYKRVFSDPTLCVIRADGAQYLARTLESEEFERFHILALVADHREPGTASSSTDTRACSNPKDAA